MIYIISSLCFFVLVLWYIRRTRDAFYCCQLLAAVRTYQDRHEGWTFYTASVLISAAKILSAHKAFWKQPVWQDIRNGRYQQTAAFLQKHDPLVALAFTAHFTDEDMLQTAQNAVGLYPQNILAHLILTAVYAAKFDYENMGKNLLSIPQKPVNFPYKGWYLILRAKYRFYQADLNAAACDAIAAEKTYKRNMLFETAEIYYLLGEIYRTCAGYDVAQMMYQTAADIYKTYNAKSREAGIIAAKGMLMAGQERFAEAAALFRKSRKIFAAFKMPKAEGEIINQQALLCLLQKKYANSLTYAQKALEKHRKIQNQGGIAHSLEIIATVLYSQKKYEQVLKPVRQAVKNYLATKNYAAYMDAMFLYANTLHNLQHTEKAENIFAKMLVFAKKHATSFHIAGVYAQLGQIFLQKGSLLKARRYYRKSLHLEEKNDRQKGALTDNFMLARIETHLHHSKAAKKYYMKALAIAEETKETKLYEKIRKEFAKINA